MAELQATNPAAAKYLADSEPSRWALYRLDAGGVVYWGQHYSNFAESENATLRQARSYSPFKFIKQVVELDAEQRHERLDLAKQWLDSGSLIAKPVMDIYQNQVKLMVKRPAALS
ncbi:unnamed protein product [Phaeothamnion confervicola]